MPGTLIRDSMSACATAVRNDAPVCIPSATELLQGVGEKVTDCTQVGRVPVLHSPVGVGII